MVPERVPISLPPAAMGPWGRSGGKNETDRTNRRPRWLSRSCTAPPFQSGSGPMNTSLTRNKSFLNLAGAQFLGHFNDNLFKMVVSLVAVEAASAKAGFYLSLASVLLVLPYLLFSGYAGHLADIASKRRVMNLCKVAEIVIMGAGFFMLAGFGSVEGLLFMLFLMAAHETFFSPSKYGF